MFPLGTVLVPSGMLPLHVFEARYRALVQDCLVGDREFGVVLIERGSEVGGGDVRTSVGTVARIVEVAEAPDGRYALGTIGTRRIRVLEWRPDDPYPRADVEDWPDPDPGPAHADLLDEAVALLRRALGLASEAGASAPPATVELSSDPILAGHQATALAPIGPLDRHRLLGAETPEVRMEQLSALLREVVGDLEARLAGG
jgi:Lon protease-like protein